MAHHNYNSGSYSNVFEITTGRIRKEKSWEEKKKKRGSGQTEHKVLKQHASWGEK